MHAAQEIITSLRETPRRPLLTISPAAGPAGSRPRRGQPIRLHFEGGSGWVNVIEASANLIDWEKIGGDTEPRHAEFGIIDSFAGHQSGCFYWIVAP